MDRFPPETPDDDPAQISQWLFRPSARRQLRGALVFLSIMIIIALVVGSLLVLANLFLPR